MSVVEQSEFGGDQIGEVVGDLGVDTSDLLAVVNVRVMRFQSVREIAEWHSGGRLALRALDRDVGSVLRLVGR